MMILPMVVSAQTSPTPAGLATLAPPSSFLSTTEAVSTILLTVAVFGVLLALIGVLLELKMLSRSVGAVTLRLEKDAAPIMERARGVAENVEFITAAVRTDVQKLNASISGLNERLREASARMEDRIQDFTALVEVLQTEAEDLALDTAAVVRGVRAGTRSLAGGEDFDPGGEGPGSVAWPTEDEEGPA